MDRFSLGINWNFLFSLVWEFQNISLEIFIWFNFGINPFSFFKKNYKTPSRNQKKKKNQIFSWGLGGFGPPLNTTWHFLFKNYFFKIFSSILKLKTKLEYLILYLEYLVFSKKKSTLKIEPIIFLIRFSSLTPILNHSKSAAYIFTWTRFQKWPCF